VNGVPHKSFEEIASTTFSLTRVSQSKLANGGRLRFGNFTATEFIESEFLYETDILRDAAEISPLFC